MELSTILMVAQTANKVIGGLQKKKGAGKVAKYQKETADQYYKYNKGQLNNAYEKSFKSMMTGYAYERANMAEEYSNVRSKINTMASQQGVNVSDSSVKDDMNNRLDYEYEANLQNLMTSNINQISTMVSNMTAQQIQLDQSYANQINTIDKAVNAVDDKVKEDIFGSILNLGVKGFDDYTDYSSRNKDENTLGKWFLDFSWNK